MEKPDGKFNIISIERLASVPEYSKSFQLWHLSLQIDVILSASNDNILFVYSRAASPAVISCHSFHELQRWVTNGSIAFLDFGAKVLSLAGAPSEIQSIGELLMQKHARGAVYIRHRSEQPWSSSAWYIPPDQLELHNALGGGQSGTVQSGLWKGYTEVAVKQITLGCDEEQLCKVASAMSALRPHPNVVQLYGASLTINGWALVTELMEAASCDAFLRTCMPPPSLEQVLHFAKHTALGMQHLRSMQIVHRHLAARNLLVGGLLSNGLRGLKVSDFWLSQIAFSKTYARNTAPEALKGNLFSYASDVWSFGVLLWELFVCSDRECSWTQPYPKLDSWQAERSITAGIILQKPPTCPMHIYELMLQCWQMDPAKRPTFDQVLSTISSAMKGTPSAPPSVSQDSMPARGSPVQERNWKPSVSANVPPIESIALSKSDATVQYRNIPELPKAILEPISQPHAAHKAPFFSTASIPNVMNMLPGKCLTTANENNSSWWQVDLSQPMALAELHVHFKRPEEVALLKILGSEADESTMKLIYLHNSATNPLILFLNGQWLRMLRLHLETSDLPSMLDHIELYAWNS